ncbi:MAG: hypothetical protein IPK19_09330 [Chloroflexi bacterium]|nr:hypothetical protein [Chloroflexota bacterium]
MNRLIRRSADQWNVPPRLAFGIFCFPLVVSIPLALSYFLEPRIVYWLAREDSVIEWLTVIVFIVGGFYAGLSAGRLLRRRRWALGLVFSGVALMAIFIAGEEISWGQRILGIETPEWMAEINWQGELNLHNTDYSPFTYAVQIAGAFGSFAYLVSRGIGRKWVDDGSGRFFIPPFFLASWFWVTFVWLFARILNILEFTPFVVRYSEHTELTLGVGFMLFMMLIHRSLKSAAAQSLAEPVHAALDVSEYETAIRPS